MGALIKIDSKEFLKHFIEEYDHNDFNIAVISDQVTVGKRKKKHRYGNVFSLENLVAPASIWNELLIKDSKKKFRKKYFSYLSKNMPSELIAVLVKMAIVDDRDVLLFSSKDECNNGMIDIIGDYIEDTYGANVCTYKQFKKNPEKYNNHKHKKRITKQIHELMKYGLSGRDYDIALTYKDAKKIHTAKQNNIKVKKDMSREEMIDKILKVF